MGFEFNLHKDTPAFIFAAGPSINELDYNEFSSQLTFACQSLITKEDFPEPKYWGLTEARDYQHHIWSRMQKEQSLAFTGELPPESYGLDKTRFYVMSVVPDQWPISPHDQPEVSFGFLGGFWSEFKTSYWQPGLSVLRGCVQPALWLGCNPIYLLGLDLSKSYWHGSDVRQEARPNHGWWDRINKALEFTKGEIEARGREIYNLSPNTNDSVLPKMTLNEAFEKEGISRYALR